MFGIPPEERFVFQSRDHARNALDPTPAEVEAATEEQLGYAAELVASKEAYSADARDVPFEAAVSS